jgi:uncharacterized protein
MTFAILAAIVLAATDPAEPELTLNQRLIMACYKVRVGEVVRCLRDGADVEARLDDLGGDGLLRDYWTGGLGYLGNNEWTALLAVAAAEKYPDPPPGLRDVWKDPERSRALREQIPKEEIAKRRADEMTIVYILLSHGCRLDVDDGFGATPLYKAVEGHKLLMAKTLLGAGANPNTKTAVYIDGPSDITPLHEASHSRELIQLLLDHGADPAAKDSDGNTPGDWVERWGGRDFDLIFDADGKGKTVDRAKPSKAAARN